MKKILFIISVITLFLPTFSHAQGDTIKVITFNQSIEEQELGKSHGVFITYKRVVINSIVFTFEREVLENEQNTATKGESVARGATPQHNIKVSSLDQVNYKSVVLINTDEWNVFNGYPITQTKVQEYLKTPIKAVIDMARSGH